MSYFNLAEWQAKKMARRANRLRKNAIRAFKNGDCKWEVVTVSFEGAADLDEAALRLSKWAYEENVRDAK